MKKPSIQDIILKKTLPNPKQNDPSTFFGHVQRNLVPEVRHEVQIFYGSLDCLEAQYPGLDYTFEPHRRRLARYPWHRRLFRTFDELRLTDHEIQSLCQWEGTRSAKERYEAETGKKIVDTTADDIAPASPNAGPRGRMYDSTSPADSQIAQKASRSAQIVNDSGIQLSEEAIRRVRDVEQQLQFAIDSGLRELASADTQWEQWMKEALERNHLDHVSILQAMSESHAPEPSSLFDNGQHRTRRSRNSSNTVLPTAQTTRTSAVQAPITQSDIITSYDEVRTMLSDLQSANNQLAADNAQLARLLSRSQPQPETAR